MSRVNATSRGLCERLGRIRAAAGRVPTYVLALVVVLVVCLLEEPIATAAGAVASLGGLALIRALAPGRGSHQPCKVPVESMRLRRRPLRRP